MRGSDVPQTVEEAKAFGWTWLTVKCVSCKHKHEFKFHDLAGRRPTLRLAALAAKLFCSKCRGRQLEFSVGAYVSGAGGVWSQSRRIVFEDGIAVEPPRE